MTLERFLADLAAKATVIRIVGGSPLYTEPLLPFAISINGFHKNAWACAINSGRNDWARVRGRARILMPNYVGKRREGAIIPEFEYRLPEGMPPVQPTTYFALLRICQSLSLPVELYGVCGRASKWHDGDWEMSYIKRCMPTVKVFDPRPAW